MAHKEMQEMLRAAAILSVASLIAKILSAFYRVPYQNLVGDTGFYVYQQIYPFYGIAMTFSLTGLPLFLSKVLQEEKEPYQQNQILKTLFPIIFWVCVALFALLFFASEPMAAAMGDVQLAGLIRVVAVMYLLTPPLAFLRGNFQGIPWMTPTALSQVGEQFLRVAIIVLAAVLYKTLNWDVYQTASLAFLGGLGGGLLALGILRHENRRTTLFRLRFTKDWWWVQDRKLLRPLLKRLVLEGGLVFLYSGLLLFYQLVDSFFVKEALVKGGLADGAAKIAKGVFDRSQPLVQLGLVVALALGSTFLPMLTRQIVKKGQGAFQQYAMMFLRLTTILAVAATVGLWWLLPFMNYALFSDHQGMLTLAIFIAAIFLVALIQAYENIMQSQNQLRIPLTGAILGLSIKLLTTNFLTEKFLTVGASLSTILGLTVTLLYLARKAGPVLGRFYRYQHFLAKTLLALGTMSLVLGAFLLLVGPLAASSRTWSLLFSIVGVVIGAGSFLFMIIRLQIFTLREWLLIPFGKKILRLFQKNNL